MAFYIFDQFAPDAAELTSIAAQFTLVEDSELVARSCSAGVRAGFPAVGMFDDRSTFLFIVIVFQTRSQNNGIC